MALTTGQKVGIGVVVVGLGGLAAWLALRTHGGGGPHPGALLFTVNGQTGTVTVPAGTSISLSVTGGTPNGSVILNPFGRFGPVGTFDASGDFNYTTQSVGQGSGFQISITDQASGRTSNSITINVK